MGYGDKLMAIGDAWALHQADPERRKVAIGNGVILDPLDLDLCWGLDHFLMSPQTFEPEHPLWVYSYRGRRPYIDYEAMNAELDRAGYPPERRRYGLARKLGRYIYNLDYRAKPAPIVFRPEEQELYEAWSRRGPFAIVEAFIKKDAPPSKQWPVERFIETALRLNEDIPVYQIATPDRQTIQGLPVILPSSFRWALPYLKAASVYIGPEGGLHHASAAVGTKAVVIYGGFTSPLITGYDFHINLTGGAEYACGAYHGLCNHCKQHLEAITVDEVVEAARSLVS
jgi:hypothetical protein